MLSKEDNELMCRVGPGTPMGNLMREYWIPAVRSDELPSPDCPPMRLRLLGENLIAFRVTSGKAGIVVNACPHRGASMFFGRNEEEGLRCVYHGWKFDTEGACVDMPSEPAESNFKSKVRIRAYPCIERNNIVWTYMGPRETPPPLPQHPGNMTPDCRVTKSVRTCSYMQALEGDIDTVHVPFLHAGANRYDEYPPGSESYYGLREKAGKIEVREHAAGTSYGVYRQAEEDTNCWRMGHFLLPFYTYNAPGILTQKSGGNAWVPIDDEHVMVWGIQDPAPGQKYGQPAIGGIFAAPKIGQERPNFGQQRRNFLPDTTDWIGKFRSVQTLENDYLIDREAQRNWVTYTGIPNGAEPEDRGMQESMGPIYDRTQEHLGTTDAMVTRTRRKLIAAAKAHRDTGVVPANVDQPELFWMFSGGAIVPKSVSGLDYCGDVLFGRAQAVEVPASGS
jgi:phenylpropionate dioxygenase-like ring-hydroxylating dioxygenase large terminal subunit